MSKRYHITPDGPKPCTATQKACQYGNHYTDIEEAQRAADDIHEMEMQGIEFDYEKSIDENRQAVNSTEDGYEDDEMLNKVYGSGDTQYKLVRVPDFNDKLEMVRMINGYNGAFDHLDYQDNDDEFFNTYYGDNPIELARAISYGDYNYPDEYVKINDYGNLESANSYQIESEIDDELDDIMDEYCNLLSEGEQDYANLFEEVEEDN